MLDPCQNYSRRRSGRRRRPECLPRGLSAAQALIAERTGMDAKTHRGVHAQFARLTRNEPRLGIELRQFLAQAYDIKSIADYGLGPDTDVPLDRAGAAIEPAEQFVNRVTELLT